MGEQFCLLSTCQEINVKSDQILVIYETRVLFATSVKTYKEQTYGNNPQQNHPSSRHKCNLRSKWDKSHTESKTKHLLSIQSVGFKSLSEASVARHLERLLWST